MREKRKFCELCHSLYIKKIYTLPNFNLMRCGVCGLIFREFLIDQAEAIALYSEEYFTVEQNNFFFKKEKEKKEIFRGRIEEINKLLPQKGLLLDVGCAIGTFLAVARDYGWSVRGVEISPYASEYARKNFGLEVLTGDMESQNFAEGFFDVITLWDVIDHTEKPQFFLDFVYRALKPGGLVVVQTTMEDSLLYSIAHFIYKLSFGLIKWPVNRCHPIHHSTFYSTKTLAMALEKAGFSIIEQRSDDLGSSLINVSTLMRPFLNMVALLAKMVGRPLEAVFFAKK